MSNVIDEKGATTVKRKKGYFIYLLIILVFVQLLDSYSASYTGSFPSKIIEEFLSGYSQNKADSIMNLSIGLATLGMYFVFFSQGISDRFGRKLMLILTTFGMGLAALLLNFSVNIQTYTIFLVFTYMFVSSDMWLIYITEESDAKHRGLYTNIVMALGILGPIFIPLFRNIFIPEGSEIGSWRGMTYFPIALAFPLGMLMIFTIKESSKFELMKKDAIKIKSELKPKFNKNLKLLFKSTRKAEVLVLAFMSFTLGLNYLLLQMAESFAASNTSLTEDAISNIIMIIAVSIIIAYLVIAFLSDKIGRKFLLYIFSAMLPIGSVLLYLGGKLGSNEFLLISMGMTMGYIGHNGLQILFRIIIVEILPTDRRGTGSGFRAFVQSLGITLGFFIGAFSTQHIGLGITFLIFGIPVLLNIPLIHIFLKETKGTDLTAVE
ncbi:MAG: MFS transporter [Candidatus Lokiarchaeota archaeon]|nr:MFS transporter [Candidatus Lokiarchaeota archaeon]